MSFLPILVGNTKLAQACFRVSEIGTKYLRIRLEQVYGHDRRYVNAYHTLLCRFQVYASDGTIMEQAFHYTVHLEAQQMRLATANTNGLFYLYDNRRPPGQHWRKGCIIL